MKVLVLGATGRSGSATLAHLSGQVETIAALRAEADIERLPEHLRGLPTALVDLNDPDTLRKAARGVDVIVNAIRLRGDIRSTELVDLHRTIFGAAEGPSASVPGGPLIVTVGGAGALFQSDGTRFWQSLSFPSRALPRGRAQANLRDYLEAGYAGDRWAYLIPPPAFYPDGPATGVYRLLHPGDDEPAFARSEISYSDFALAVADAALVGRTGTRLVAGAAWQ
ncbi:MAG: NAD(P)H-binding protein [Actinomycetaceae bacterium]|nr:NAD(P)H-binding protein [Actinomycetaceae bacterium]